MVVFPCPFFGFPDYACTKISTILDRRHRTREVTSRARWGRRQLELSNRKLLYHSKSLDVSEGGL